MKRKNASIPREEPESQNKISRRTMLKFAVSGSLGGLAAEPLLLSSAAQAQTLPPAGLAQDMATAANAFLNSLNAKARGKAAFVFSNSERFRWHWTTPDGFSRNGLPLNEMSAEQKTLALSLLRSGSSKSGAKKALEIMALQTELKSDPEDYYVSIFGTPGGAAPWGWRFEGHHLSRQFTVVGGKVAVTPFFLGAWPTQTAAGARAMPREEDAARELIRALEGSARETALFQAASLTAHVTGNDAKVRPPEPVGILYSELKDAQRSLVMELIRTYLDVLPETLAKAGLERITVAGVDKIRFGWAGSLEPRQPHYYRLQGPTFLLEFDNSRNSGTHIHSVWRDYDQDFGYHLL